MKFSLLLAVLPALAIAAPTPENDGKAAEKTHDKPAAPAWRDEYQDSHKGDKYDEAPKDEHHDDSWKGSFPFEFTSTLVAYADGNQIINNSQVAVPGLSPDGYGKFAFGLNSNTNTICHVSLSRAHVWSPLIIRTSPSGSEVTTSPQLSPLPTSTRPPRVLPVPQGSLSQTPLPYPDSLRTSTSTLGGSPSDVSLAHSPPVS
jgi:hypothetical protein